MSKQKVYWAWYSHRSRITHAWISSSLNSLCGQRAYPEYRYELGGEDRCKNCLATLRN